MFHPCSSVAKNKPRMLDGIGKGLFGATELYEACNQKQKRDGEAGKPLLDLNLSLSHQGETKTFDDGNNGIKSHDPLEVFRHH